MSEELTYEKLKIVLKLYSIKDGSMNRISEKIGVTVPQLSKIKRWLIEHKILVPQGNIFIKSGSRHIPVEYF